MDTKTIGMFTRAERIFTLVIGAWIGQLIVALWVLAIFNSLSALQRVIYTLGASPPARSSSSKEVRMSVLRISEFQSKEGKVEELREFLLTIVSVIKGSEGCPSVQLCQSRDDPSMFMMIETWHTVEAHQLSVKNISPEKLAAVRPLLASPPRGSYYDLIHEQ